MKLSSAMSQDNEIFDDEFFGGPGSNSHTSSFPNSKKASSTFLTQSGPEPMYSSFTAQNTGFDRWDDEEDSKAYEDSQSQQLKESYSYEQGKSTESLSTIDKVDVEKTSFYESVEELKLSYRNSGSNVNGSADTEEGYEQQDMQGSNGENSWFDSLGEAQEEEEERDRQIRYIAETLRKGAGYHADNGVQEEENQDYVEDFEGGQEFGEGALDDEGKVQQSNSNSDNVQEQNGEEELEYEEQNFQDGGEQVFESEEQDQGQSSNSFADQASTPPYMLIPLTPLTKTLYQLSSLSLELDPTLDNLLTPPILRLPLIRQSMLSAASHNTPESLHEACTQQVTYLALVKLVYGMVSAEAVAETVTLAHLYDRRGLWQQAVHHCTQALQLASCLEKYRDKESLRRLYLTMGNALFMLMRYP
jgi:hypothetical protein